jgi:aminocarboxymuconate-semialdehyde decarboxylase
MLIDSHAHVIPGEYPADGPACFPTMELLPDRTERRLSWGTMTFDAKPVFFDAEQRVAALDEGGVDVEVLSPMPPLLRYDLPVDDGRELSRYVNEYVAGLVAAAPSRLLGFGMVPLQDPELAAEELSVIADLGLVGVEIASAIEGRSPGDPRFLDFFREAERLDLPVFIHAMPGSSDRLPDDARPTYTVGVEGAFAAGSLVAGGTMAACPDLRISLSHAGGGYPMVLPRAQYFWGRTWNEEPPAPGHEANRPSPLETARRFYYDALVFDRRALRYLIDLLGADRLLLGSDFPAMPREEPADRTLRSMELPDDVLGDITWNNAWRFLGARGRSAWAGNVQEL